MPHGISGKSSDRWYKAGLTHPIPATMQYLILIMLDWCFLLWGKNVLVRQLWAQEFFNPWTFWRYSLATQFLGANWHLSPVIWRLLELCRGVNLHPPPKLSGSKCTLETVGVLCSQAQSSGTKLMIFPCTIFGFCFSWVDLITVVWKGLNE